MDRGTQASLHRRRFGQDEEPQEAAGAVPAAATASIRRTRGDSLSRLRPCR
jgi:hypothetical protein